MTDRFGQPPTIGVLSTSFGGLYFGQIMAGIAAATASAGGRLLAVQTFEAGTYSRDLSEPPSFRPRVAWDHISAFAVILNGVDQVYLEAVRAAGKPVVVISDTIPGFSCPVVLPDNRTGIEQAVDHLVKHGHSKIAFAGFPVTTDLRERFDTYRDTLLKHGITPDPALFYNTQNNQESGGEDAAEAMIAAGLPSTAVIAGNDLNAVGIMRVLQAAGYELPRDQAVVGFDDVEKGVYLSPSLSSVRQELEVVGATATGLLLRLLDGDDVPDGYYPMPTVFVPRESCGCPSTLTLGDSHLGSHEIRDCESLAARLSRVMIDGGPGIAPATPDPSGDRRLRVAEGAGLICDVLHAAAAGVPGPDDARVRAGLTELQRRSPGSERLVQIMRDVRGYARHLASTLPDDDEPARERVEDALQEIVLALSLTQTRLRDSDNARFEATFNSQHTVSMQLLRSAHEKDPRELAWLDRTPARAAVVGLWADDPSGEPGDRALRIAGRFPADRPGADPGTPAAARRRRNRSGWRRSPRRTSLTSPTSPPTRWSSSPRCGSTPATGGSSPWSGPSSPA